MDFEKSYYARSTLHGFMVCPHCYRAESFMLQIPGVTVNRLWNVANKQAKVMICGACCKNHEGEKILGGNVVPFPFPGVRP